MTNKNRSVCSPYHPSLNLRSNLRFRCCYPILVSSMNDDGLRLLKNDKSVAFSLHEVIKSMNCVAFVDSKAYGQDAVGRFQI
jgi:hypothetical protein